jgi:hypothetical protein
LLYVEFLVFTVYDCIFLVAFLLFVDCFLEC